VVTCIYGPGHWPRQGHAFPIFPEEGVIPLECPVLVRHVPAGGPSPAADFAEDRLNLDEYLIEHREATFFVRVAGSSMTGFGIHDGDLLVVDRSITPTDRSVIVALIDGDFTVKQFCRIPDGVLLRSGANGHSDILKESAIEIIALDGGARPQCRPPPRAQRSRAASWKAFCTGESRYSNTVRVPRWISAETCMPGARRNFSPSTSRNCSFRFTRVR
jgi:DNA polymerase V